MIILVALMTHADSADCSADGYGAYPAFIVCRDTAMVKCEVRRQ
ncbi:MAG: hypothetical protein OXG92_14755 [Chloroflexi bacterium]|nr:hypothetical protein [Chloroflexota bacterium]MCY3583968.1 hypothetical protein [Chloroflexota bacterium]MCY3717707.1 hypothetical protein [Chloroflexota bacterium]MDE2649285.1 hypothetical protein [Chloroflexota bacterium]